MYKSTSLKEAIIFAPVYQTFRMEHQATGITIHNADSTVVFERVFKEHFKGLHAYAFTILKDSDEAEEIVQNVFFKLWERKDQLGALQSAAAYLYRSVYNESMNFLKHEKVKKNYEAHAVHQMATSHTQPADGSHKSLEQKIQAALNDLPEQCRTIFQMSRFDELKYREIADRLNISVKTVENQMSKALKIMRTKLVEYLPVIWLLLVNLKNVLK